MQIGTIGWLLEDLESGHSCLGKAECKHTSRKMKRWKPIQAEKSDQTRCKYRGAVFKGYRKESVRNFSQRWRRTHY